MSTTGNQYLGRVEITQQPEKVFYKDEGGQRLYYLYLFYVVVGERTPELQAHFDRVSDGRMKIGIDCKLLYDGTMEDVEDQSILQLLGNSHDHEVSDTTPSYDPVTGAGSLRFRITKVSMKKDNQFFRLQIGLRGLENVVQPAVTEPTHVLSKRKRLRKCDRIPEQMRRDQIEKLARKRNAEVQAKLATLPITPTPIIHRITPAHGFTAVPDFKELRLKPSKRKADEPPTLDVPPAIPHSSQTPDLHAKVDDLEKRLQQVEGHMRALEGMIQLFGPSHQPGEGGSMPDVPPGEPNSMPSLQFSLNQPNGAMLQETLSNFFSQFSQQNRNGGLPPVSATSTSSRANNNTAPAIPPSAGAAKGGGAKGKGKRARKV